MPLAEPFDGLWVVPTNATVLPGLESTFPGPVFDGPHRDAQALGDLFSSQIGSSCGLHGFWRQHEEWRGGSRRQCVEKVIAHTVRTENGNEIGTRICRRK